MFLLRWFVMGLHFTVLTQIVIAKSLFWNRLLRLELLVSVLEESKKVLTVLVPVLLGIFLAARAVYFRFGKRRRYLHS